MNAVSLFKNCGSFESQVGKVTRSVNQGMKVRVYRNLNKPEFYSILAREGEHKGKVVGYAKCVQLDNATFIVSEKSRQRVVRDQRRNVHAFVEGIITDAFDAIQVQPGNEYITYNPYARGEFFNPETQAAQTEGADQVLIQEAGVYIQ
ncbi:hypothetical protein [Pseudoalteromonas rubra]|uniref:hypothetical protein n=1 Tax=Pseudoalteromonas rubra TaxID=43658 RepID=UPI002DB9AAB2|nr:hypothetical protein [Pseudoalteromonas rubra]MEC4091610.1 hypothetical protein [Pseudoalteromonas rubra]